MAKKVRSLSDQMAELSNVAPGDADFDPESDVDAYDAVQREGENDSDEDLEDEARSHARHTYVDVAPSKMRRQANHMEGVYDDSEKYTGIKATRREMMGENDEASENEDNDDEDDDVDEELEEERLSRDAEHSGDDDIEEEDEKSSLEQGRKPRVRFETAQEDIPSEVALNAAQTDAQLLQDLRKRSREDAEKGRDAKRQMDSWGKLLGMRIRGQKVIRGAGRIPSKLIKHSLEELSEADREAYSSTLSSLDEISSQLFALQRQVLQSFTSIDSLESSVIHTGLSRLDNRLEQVSKPTKRSYNDMEDVQQNHLSTLFQLDQTVFDPLWRDVLARWSSRTSVSNLDEGRKNKFQSSLKAMNQSAEDQIDRGLTGDAFDRLRKRTRVWRGSEKEFRLAAESARPSSQEDDSDDEEQKKEGDHADIFDDSDFYATLLRELIDSRGVASVMGADGGESSLAWAQAAKRATKKNKNGDMRASKGRKLRFDVIEKLENFMPPIPRETWSKDQIDRLFNQLRGGDQESEEQAVVSNGTGDSKGEKVELAGLRLFG